MISIGQDTNRFPVIHASKAKHAFPGVGWWVVLRLGVGVGCGLCVCGVVGGVEIGGWGGLWGVCVCVCVCGGGGGGGGTGFTLSVCLFIFYNIRRIHFIFTHLIKHLQVCRVERFCFSNLKNWSFGKFFKWEGVGAVQYMISETHLKHKFRDISLAHNLFLSCQNISIFCTEHGSKDWKKSRYFMDQRDFARCEFKMSFRRISCIAQPPKLSASNDISTKTFKRV